MQEITQKMIDEAKEMVPTIPCEEFFNLEELGELPLVLDVRSEEDYNAGHIDASTHLALENIEKEIQGITSSMQEPIIICCARGNSAAIAGKILMDMGYSNVKYLSGGYTGYCGGEDKEQLSEIDY